MEYLAVLDEQHAAGAAGRLDGVGDHEDGLAPAVHVAEQRQELIGGPGVQCAGGLVRQQQAGLGDKCAGHGGALLLAAGHLVGVLFQQVRDAQLVRQRTQAVTHLAVRTARQHQRQIDVVLQREGIQQVELLKHEAQMVTAEGGGIRLLHGGQVTSVQTHRAGGRGIQRRQNVQQRGLAGAGFAHDGHIFALLHRELHVVQGLHAAAAEAGGIHLAQTADFQNRHKNDLLLFAGHSIAGAGNGCHSVGLHFPPVF